MIKIFPVICGGVTVDSILECPLSAPGTWGNSEWNCLTWLWGESASCAQGYKHRPNFFFAIILEGFMSLWQMPQSLCPSCGERASSSIIPYTVGKLCWSNTH